MTTNGSSHAQAIKILTAHLAEYAANPAPNRELLIALNYALICMESGGTCRECQTPISANRSLCRECAHAMMER